jgi:hypothetical protein
MSGTMSNGPLAALERYLDATAASPPPDLVEHISARLLLEPSSTAPRRYLAAIRALDLRAITRGLAQNATAAFRPGPRSMLLRAQAMAIVLVTLATVGFGSVAGLAATQQVAQHVVTELAAWSKGSISSPAAPAAPVAPSIEQLEPERADHGLGGADPAGQPSSVDQDRPGKATVDRGKAEPPAGKGSDRGKARSLRPRSRSHSPSEFGNQPPRNGSER